MKNPFRFSALFTAALLTTSSQASVAHESTQAFDAVRFSERFLEAINEKMGTQIKLVQIRGKNLELQMPRGGDGNIYFNTADLKAYSKSPYGDRTREALAFVIAHEASHNLIDFYTTVKEAAVPDELTSALSSSSVPSDYDFGALTGNLEHENVDAFAAKLLREFGIPIEGGILAVEDSAARYPVIPDSPALRRVREERGRVIRAAYEEGWGAWSGYQRMISPCAIEADRVFAFFERIGANAILNRIGRKRCTYFSAEIFLETIHLGRERFKRFAL